MDRIPSSPFRATSAFATSQRSYGVALGSITKVVAALSPLFQLLSGDSFFVFQQWCDCCYTTNGSIL